MLGAIAAMFAAGYAINTGISQLGEKSTYQLMKECEAIRDQRLARKKAIEAWDAELLDFKKAGRRSTYIRKEAA